MCWCSSVNTAHRVVSSVLEIVCPGCQYIPGYSLCRSFEYHWQGDLIKVFLLFENLNNL